MAVPNALTHPGSPCAGGRNKLPRVLLGTTEHLLGVKRTVDSEDPEQQGPKKQRASEATTHTSLPSPTRRGLSRRCLLSGELRFPVYAIRSGCLKAASDCSNPTA